MGIYKTATEHGDLWRKAADGLRGVAARLDIDSRGIPKSESPYRVRGIARAIYETSGGTRMSPPGSSARKGFGHPDQDFIDTLNRRMRSSFTLADAGNWNVFADRISPLHDVSIDNIHARNKLARPTEGQYMMAFRWGAKGRNTKDTENYTEKAMHDAALFYAQPERLRRSRNGEAPEAARKLYTSPGYRKAVEDWLQVAAPARRWASAGLRGIANWLSGSRAREAVK